MKHRERITRYRTLREQPQWKLLAAANAPEIIGLLQSLLMDGERTLPAAALHERLQRALDQLNGEELSRELPRTAQAYIAHWLARAGWSGACPTAPTRSSTSCPPRRCRPSGSPTAWSRVAWPLPKAAWRW